MYIVREVENYERDFNYWLRAGFIGSNLAERLIERGYYVTGVDRFTDRYSPKLKQFNLNNF
ncbi:MAG: NAD-dependent epimerase/dehydratase family protein [Nitrososphaeria archaeon]